VGGGDYCAQLAAPPVVVIAPPPVDVFASLHRDEQVAGYPTEPKPGGMNVPSMFPECSANVPSMFRECSANVPRMFRECSANVQRRWVGAKVDTGARSII